MSVALDIDHHVKVAIPAALRQRGVDVLTSAEDGTEEWNDEKLMEVSVALHW